MPINPKIKTIQLLYDPASALLNGGFCNFVMPVQGYYDVLIKQTQLYGSVGTEQIMTINSPQLKNSFACYAANGGDGIVQNAFNVPTLQTNFVMTIRNEQNTVTSPVLLPRCLLQNSIQMDIRDPLGIPLQSAYLALITLELHECRDVYDTKMPFV